MKIEKTRLREVSSMKVILTFICVFFLFSTFLSAHFQDYKWEKKTPLEKPSPRHGHTMAYDSIREEVILFGGMGQANSDLKNDTWKWDGSNWLQMYPMDSPSPRVHHHMVYDSGRDKIVLFGGCGEGNVDVNDLWEWDGNNWLKREDIPEPKPEARRAFGMTYDNISRRIYIFGGFSESGYTWFSDFWCFDGTSWTLIDQPGQLKPSARAMVKMVFDESMNVIFIHGGHLKHGNIFNDSWIWDGINWIELNPNDPYLSPSQYSAFAMEYMKNEGILVKFGGATTPGVMQNETWIWDWIKWDDLGSDNLPAPRECTSMAYDIKHKIIVMFGGFGGDYGNYRTLNDTWIFSRINQIPIAICKDIDFAADENGQAIISPEDIDDGSYDPDGDDFTLSIDSMGPFGLGEHFANLTITDKFGASDTCTAKVTVVDQIPPVPDVETLPELIGEGSVEISIFPTATDNCSGIIEGTTEDPLIFLEIGTYTVTWIFDDENGNITTQMQIVTVEDTTPPVPDVEVLPTVSGECSAEITDIPIAADSYSGSITGTTTDPLLFTEQGTYTVTWFYDDGNGNIATQSQTVVVKDVTSPTFHAISVSPNILWPPNHKMILITPTFSVSDNCDPDPTIELTLITMNEGDETNTYDPNYDDNYGDGNTTNDIYVDDDGKIYLRAERSGNGTGRIYTIKYTVTDASGNSSTTSVSVSVPHNM